MKKSSLSPYFSIQMMTTWPSLLLLLVSMLANNPFVTALDERRILVEFFEATNGGQWLKKDNWGTDAPICSWHGISCLGGTKSGDSEVDTLQLTENNIAGSIPASLYSMPLLRFLDLEGNPITNAGFEGFQQAEEATGVSVSPLETLALNGCNLQDVTGIGRAPESLLDLRLADNDLKGDFPSEIFQVTSLRRLFLDQNGITGSLPSTIGNMQRLIDFHAIGVPFKGQIPSEFGLLTRMVTLVMRDNDFVGTIPTELNNMINLEILSIGRSPKAGQGQLSGPLPAFSQLQYLELLDFSFERLNGTIPRDFFLDNQRTDDLVIVRINGNELTGTIPKQLGWIDSMDLGLTGNKLVGPIPEEICEKKQWMTGLVEQFSCDAILCPAGTYNTEGKRTLTADCSPCDGAGASSPYLGQTSCYGAVEAGQPWKVLPEFYTALQGPSWDNAAGWSTIDTVLKDKKLSDLKSTDLNVCSFYGVTCTPSGDILKLELPDNSLYGVIPASVFTISTLTTFDVSSNKVSMDQDAFKKISDIKAISKLDLSHTEVSSLSGLKGVTSLETLYLDGNAFESSIPDDLFTLTNLVELEISNSQLRGPIPSGIARLQKLKRVDFRWNELSALPTEFGVLTNLESLDLSYNKFEGTFPTEMNSLASLRELQLSRASRGGLSGELPSLEGLKSLQVLGFSRNDFQGTIPSSFLSGVTLKSDNMKVSLSYNRLEGVVPQQLDVFSSMVLELEGNLISDLPSTFCDNSFWMEGYVAEATFGCNAILCPPGTWNKNGKETKSSLCLPCEETDDLFGETECGSSTSDSPPAQSVAPGSSPAPQPPLIKTETEILDMLFAATNGEDWTGKHNGWLPPAAPVCEREGVSCNDDGKIESLRLNKYGLNGQIPTEIFQLQSNRVLGFTDNDVDLRFDGIEQATALETLLMSNTKLKNLEGLQHAPPSLKAIHLARNDLDGGFPRNLLSLGSLHKVYLNQNKFTGTIPTEIASMSELREFHIWDNRLTGHLPSEIGSLVGLQDLDLSSNLISGPIPTQLGLLSSITGINLSNQQGSDKLGGPLYDFATNPLLHTLNVSNNELAGTLPPTILSAVNKTKKTTLDFSNNKLSGEVPAQLNVFEALDLFLAGNMISSLPSSLCSMPNWMNGDVGKLNTCDAILCPPGTFSVSGRADSTRSCAPCSAGGSATYYGTTSCSNDAHDSEREILTKFFQDLNGDNWLSNFNWATESGVCTWFGVTCNDDLSVVELKLASNQIVSTKDQLGSLAPIFQLPNLQVLDFKGNSVYMDFRQITFSPSLQSMRVSGTGLTSLAGINRASGLRRLHATDNLLNSSSIPDDVFDLPELRSLYLSFNGIGGSIPSKISQLSNLEEFYVYGNQLEKNLPSEIGLLQELRELVLARNFIHGTIPAEFSSLGKLEQLSLYDQQGESRITGNIPTFENAPNLWFFDISNCDLSGTIPNNFMENSVHLNATITMILKNNQIAGTIPSALKKFNSLDIDLTGNKVEGISQDLCGKSGWMNGELELVGNCDAILCPPGSYTEQGRQRAPDSPCHICEDLKGVPFMGQTVCKSFEGERGALSLLYSSAGGKSWKSKKKWTSDAPICSWEGIECSNGNSQNDTGVTTIKLEKNSLAGSLPTALWSLPSLQALILNGNEDLVISFDGLSNAASLEILQISNTKIDSIEGISQATSLKELYFDENGLTGTFPNEIFGLHASLEKLRFSANYFYGSLPPEIAKMTKLIEFHVANNEFYSTIPSEIAQIDSLQSVALNENLFYGDLPTELSTMPLLQIFSVRRERKSGPKLSGKLPKFDQNPSLNVLFLDGNDFTGVIPSDFLKSSSSVYLVDLKNNSLSGGVPETLDSLNELDIRLEGNQISSLPGAFCDNADWMGGNVGRLKSCDAILCSPGSANPSGRALNSPNECVSCSNPKAAPFYGSRTCDSVLTEKEILVKLYDACNGAEWKISRNWNTNVDICDWHGIGCKGGHVILINLGANNLSGTPPPELFDLPKLEILWLNSNPIQFSFAHIGRAKNLMDLRVDETSLTTLAGVGSAIYLTSLHVGFNSVGGQFPPELLQLKNIRTLSMNNCFFTGTLPDFSDLEFLRTLRLSDNKFSGPVPSFDGMHILNTLDVANNLLEGRIPSNFLERIGLRLSPEVDLSSNLISGEIPGSLARFDDLSLYLRGNEINTIPGVLCNKPGWMKGGVGKFGCDAILCAPGTSSFDGRHSSRSPGCSPCGETDTYYGSTACLNSSLGYSAATSFTGVNLYLALGVTLVALIGNAMNLL